MFLFDFKDVYKCKREKEKKIQDLSDSSVMNMHISGAQKNRMKLYFMQKEAARQITREGQLVLAIKLLCSYKLFPVSCFSDKEGRK